MITVFYVVDEVVPHATDGHRLHLCGPKLVLADNEVIMMEAVGAYLGLQQDNALFAYFFPAWRTLLRITRVRRMANL